MEFIEEILSNTNQVSSEPEYGNATNYYKIDISKNNMIYVAKSGTTHLAGDGTGFEIRHGTDTTVIIPKYLLDHSNPILRVTLEEVGIQNSYGLEKSTPNRFSRSLPKNGFPNFTGEAHRQDILTQINSATPVVVSGVISVSMDTKAFNSDATVFFDANNWEFHGGFSKGLSSSKSNKVFSGSTGLAYHTGSFDVFEKLGASYQASYFGLAFTIDDNNQITSDGVIMFLSTDSEFSAKGAAAKDLSPFIKKSLFLLNETDMDMVKALYWIHVVSNLNKALDSVLANITESEDDCSTNEDCNSNEDNDSDSDNGSDSDSGSVGGGVGGGGGINNPSDDSSGIHNWGGDGHHGNACSFCHAVEGGGEEGDDVPAGIVTVGPITVTPIYF